MCDKYSGSISHIFRSIYFKIETVRILLCSCGCPGTCCVGLANLELREICLQSTWTKGMHHHTWIYFWKILNRKELDHYAWYNCSFELQHDKRFDLEVKSQLPVVYILGWILVSVVNFVKVHIVYQNAKEGEKDQKDIL